MARSDYGVEIVSDEELARISAAGLPSGMRVAKANGNADLLKISDSELEAIAAGQENKVSPEKTSPEEVDVPEDPTAGALVPGADASIEDSPSETILNFEPDGESVEYWRVQQFILNPLPFPGGLTNSNIQPTTSNIGGNRAIISILDLGNFSGRIQFGDPAGNFLPDLGGPIAGAGGQ